MNLINTELLKSYAKLSYMPLMVGGLESTLRVVTKKPSTRIGLFCGTPGRIRTADPLFRRQML